MINSQWDCVLQNLGQWQGSFTHFSPQAELLDDIPSHISLEGVNQNQSIHLVLRRFYPAQPGSSELQPHQLERSFSSPGAGALFFESGAFSEGSIYFAPGMQFGAEFCLLQEPRRLRLVQIFNSDGQLDHLTLIREKRPDSSYPDQPGLTIPDLSGEWHGEAMTLSHDSPTPESGTTTLRFSQIGDDRLMQQSSLHPAEPCSVTVIDPLRLAFEQNAQPYQTLLFPNGASSTAPVQLAPGHAFYLELGWLLQPGLRQRMIRYYNAEGKWERSTWIRERQVQR